MLADSGIEAHRAPPRATKAIVLVTHDMNWVTQLCNRAILIEKGQVVLEGNPEDVVRLHQEHSERSKREREAMLARAASSHSTS